MAKNTNDESAGTAEPTVTFNRKKLVTAGWIAGGVLALGATFAAGAAVAQAVDGHRDGGHAAVGSTGMAEGHGPKGGPHEGPHAGDRGMGEGPHDMEHGPRGDKDGDRGAHGELGELQYEGQVDAPSDGSTLDGTLPGPSETP